MTLGSRLRRSGLKSDSSRPKGPIWEGPESGGSNGGITQSLLSRFLCCRERFRLLVVEGLQPADAFNHRLEYGQMWHTCEEVHASGAKDWALHLYEYAQNLCRKYPFQQEQAQHWYNVCKVQFPIYVEYWSKHPDVKNRTPLLQEQTFHVPYKLPSSRTVYLRGKWDSVDLIGKGKAAGIYLQENKTKGDIKEAILRRQLESGFDLQTILYLVALGYAEDLGSKGADICGVRYNVTRRPLSGGRGSITKHKGSKNVPAETDDEFYARLGSIIQDEAKAAVKEKRDCSFFMRWKIEVSPQDVERFCRECLDPILEQLCDWWEHITGNSGRESPFDCRAGDRDYMIHWRHPFGVYNVMDEGGASELDEYLATGSTLGLERTDRLFRELDDA